MEQDKDLRDAKENNLYFDDLKEFFAKFIFTPNFEGYEHITKDLGVTNLRSKFNEPEIARVILQSFHILCNEKYYQKTKETRLIAYQDNEITNQNGIIGTVKTPLYKQIDTLKSKYPKTYHFLLSKWVSLVSTSLARDGHLMRSFSTRRIEREESVEDKTNVSPKIINLGGQQRNRQ